jgi:serine/threonine-protein kinase HipA
MDCRPGHVDSASFRYGSRYVERVDAVSIDPLRLPILPKGPDGLAPTQIVAVDGELVSAIRDASPDGFGRLVLARAFGQAQLDEFDYLISSGTHRVGALAFGSDPAQPPHVHRPEGRRQVSDEIDIDAAIAGYSAFERKDYASQAFGEFVEGASSLGGARPKAAVILEQRHWLAKFSKPDDTFDAIRVEAGVMRLAAEAGFNVPEIRVETARHNRPVFLIERFDRRLSEDGNNLDRIPFMSALSATGHTELNARYGSYEEVADACRKFGANVESDLRDLFRRATFNVLTGNDDDHLRNHGFLYEHAKGTWQLSPLYDVAPRPQTSSTRKLAIFMRSDDEDRPSNLRHVVDAAPIFGLKPDEAAFICEELRAFVAANWSRHLKEVGLPDDEIDLVAGCFAESARSIMDQAAPTPTM